MNEQSDARWFAHLVRLGVLPEGSISPKAERAVREVLRKRAHLVRQQTAQVLSIQNLLMRHTGTRFTAQRMHALSPEALRGVLPEPDQILAVWRSLAVLHTLPEPIMP